MNKHAAFILVLLLSTPSWSEPSVPDSSYIQPYPNSTGAQLLPYCEKTDDVVSQLRCNYYVQGVADLATIPQQGKPLACIPQGQNQTQLIQIAVDFLKLVNPKVMVNESAASQILRAFIKAFPCPVEKKAGAKKALRKEKAQASMKAANEAKEQKDATAPE